MTDNLKFYSGFDSLLIIYYKLSDQSGLNINPRGRGEIGIHASLRSW